MINVGNLRARRIQTRLNRQRRKAAEVFVAVEPLFRNRKQNPAIENDGRRCVGVKHVQPKNQHAVGLALSENCLFYRAERMTHAGTGPKPALGEVEGAVGRAQLDLAMGYPWLSVKIRGRFSRHNGLPRGQQRRFKRARPAIQKRLHP